MTIRDPSDGTVYEKPRLEISGLPKLEKPDDTLRLEKARLWLEEWKKEKALREIAERDAMKPDSLT
jgi:hypothetical protein